MAFQCFAYGSNMFTPKMRRAAGSAAFSAIAHLPGYRLRFNKVSDDGSGKGNVVLSGEADADVWGVVFEIADQDAGQLDRSEDGYDRMTIEVIIDDDPRTIFTYIARADRTNDTLAPYTWYKEFVVRGAQEHGLPQPYIQALQAVAVIPDPKKERERRNRALLE